MSPKSSLPTLNATAFREMPHNIFSNHFQVAYVVDDIERGMNFFRDNFAIAKWHFIDSSGPDSPVNAMATAYIDNIMVELLQPSALPSIYRNWLQPGGPGIRFHHLGYLVKTEEDWQATLNTLRNNGFADAYSDDVPDVLNFIYADTTKELGHYCEYIFLKPGGLEMFAPVPRN
ncbi:VOC family protein [Novosphingobium sp. G106]|uniref:VOC family protein n=1 Tax=Novosphingobium sp. G106 TaxID=2849500 RepID=UPI001C2DE232|nr:VOC family protein [Novosphingobium sp. G106]MBV1688884.1 VOC family protein [Novosphingobium sp. G106]